MPYTLKPPFWTPAEKPVGPRRRAPVAPVAPSPEPDAQGDVDPAWRFGRKPTRRIEVQTTPSKARIYVDGRYRSKTPCWINIPTDREVSIVVEADGYGKAVDRILPTDPDFYQITLVELTPDPDPDRVL